MEITWSWSVTGYTFAGRPHEEIRQTCRAAGAAGIEGAAEVFPGATPPELEKLAAAYRADGLTFDTFHLPFTAADDVASFYETARRQAVETMRHWLERAGALGVRAVILHPSATRYNVDAEGLDPYLRQLGRSLETLLPAAAGLGIVVAVENMLPGEAGGRFCSRPEHFERLTREFADPSLGYCLDTGHALVAGGGPAGAARFPAAMGRHLVAFHLADNAGDRDSHLAPGRGLVDWGPVFRAAAANGYRHSMCIETPPFAAGPAYSLQAWQALVRGTEALARHALSER
ncbi:MAG: sugar phosphate isomerase/epimerase family protein [Gemmatimonadota bacterium]